MTLGQRIQQIRIEHNLSQEEFAAKLGTTRQSVSRWELDQTYPEISKIVLISKIFSVSTDSVLKNGISTFDTEVEHFTCGVYRGAKSEIVETDKFVLVIYSSYDKNILGARLYKGFENKKRLVAVCERNIAEERTEFAYSVEDSDPYANVSNSERLKKCLTEAYDPSVKRSMRRLEYFEVDHDGSPLPTVKEAGIPKCLTLWRMADSYFSSYDRFNFYLCTGKTEYVFSIDPKDTNIYCGASYNIVFDLGLFSGGQFFRIRNYKDNSEKWTRFFCDFSYEAGEINIPTDQCELGKCIQTSKGLMWCVKRYSDDEIVLQGCGDDEYTYRREDKRTEQFKSL
ncbi:MAG: helix-turn-helix transcriptional regulator [Ruminococcaceae bacterium]|nr:helix-turn-helix transcriptional regulator [Oscillospiraceae bacterium]